MYKAEILSGENYRFKGITLDALNMEELIQKITKYFKIDYKTLVMSLTTKMMQRVSIPTI